MSDLGMRIIKSNLFLGNDTNNSNTNNNLSIDPEQYSPQEQAPIPNGEAVPLTDAPAIEAGRPFVKRAVRAGDERDRAHRCACPSAARRPR